MSHRHPRQPVLLTRSGPTPQRAPARACYDGTIRVAGSRVYAVLDRMGLVVYDASNPAQVQVVSHTPLPGQPREIYRGLWLAGEHLYTVNYRGEVRIFAVPR